MTVLRALATAVAAVVVAVPGTAAAPTTAAHACVRGNELWFRAADGTRLVGHRFGKGTTAVILAHQSGGDLCPWVPYARALAARGFFVFPFDFRGHGFSRPRPGAAANRLPADVSAATKAVRRLGKKKVFVVGASLGGIASVVAAANTSPPVDGVVSIAAPGRYRGMDAVAAARRLRVPALFIAAEGDRTADFDFAADARAIDAAALTSDKRLELVPGTRHGIELVRSSSAVRTLIETFIRTH